MLTAVVAMAVLGGVLGLILAYASQAFKVEIDPRVAEVASVLPNVNCGACGLPGCAGYAEAVVLKGAAVNLCAPGGPTVAHRIAAIMGCESQVSEPNYALCTCQAQGVETRFHYDGVADCRAANLPGMAGGLKACRYGCLGLGSCVSACPFGALSLGPDKLPKVDETKCTGCRKCVAVCPRNLMRVDGESRTVFVKCLNRDPGAVANKLCGHPCIACKKCEKECPFDAIHVVDNLAVIDYDKCKLCGKCVGVCPKQVIVNLRAERRERKAARTALAEAVKAASGEGAA